MSKLATIKVGNKGENKSSEGKLFSYLTLLTQNYRSAT